MEAYAPVLARATAALASAIASQQGVPLDAECVQRPAAIAVVESATRALTLTRTRPATFVEPPATECNPSSADLEPTRNLVKLLAAQVALLHPDE